MEAPPLTEDEMNEVYNWVDEIPLSKPKKSITRDFADGVLLAEVVAHFIPKLVEIHNYSSAHSVTQKHYNWNTLNQKVFKKLGFQLQKSDIDAVIACQPEACERVLRVVKNKIERYIAKGPQSQTGTIMSPPLQQQNMPPPQRMMAPPPMMPKHMMGPGGGGGGGGGMPMYQPMPHPGGRNMAEMYQSSETNSQKHGGMQPPMRGRNDAGDKEHIHTINELKDTISILETKIAKMDQLIKLKDSKIQTLTNKLSQYENGKS